MEKVPVVSPIRKIMDAASYGLERRGIISLLSTHDSKPASVIVCRALMHMTGITLTSVRAH